MNTEEQKKAILDYLENAYVGARAMDDLEVMCRLSRAILAFSHDDLEHMPTWEEKDVFKIVLTCPACGGVSWARKELSDIDGPDIMFECLACGELVFQEDMCSRAEDIGLIDNDLGGDGL